MAENGINENVATNKDFSKCKKIFSKVSAGRETEVVWVLEDWRNSLERLCAAASCTLQIDNTSLSFSLRKRMKSLPNVFEEGMDLEETWLALVVHRISPCEQTQTFQVQIDKLGEDLKVSSSYPPLFAVFRSLAEEVVLEEDFIYLSEMTRDVFGMRVKAPHTQQPDCLRFGITVIPLAHTPKHEDAQELTLIRLLCSDGVELLAEEANLDNPTLRNYISRARASKDHRSGRDCPHVQWHLASKVGSIILKWLQFRTVSLPLDQNVNLDELIKAANRLRLTDLVAKLRIWIKQNINLWSGLDNQI